MKKIFFLSAATVAAMLSFSGCSDDFNYDTAVSGEGRVMMRANVNSDVKVLSRAGVTDDELAASTLIWISNSKGVVRKYNGIGEVPAAGIVLVADSYVAEAWAGDSVSASWDKRYFKGVQPFTVSGGNTCQVIIECKIANSVATVAYDSQIDEVLSDYTMTIGTRATDGKLTWTGRNDEGKPGYFMIPSWDKNLTYTLTGKLVNGETFTKTGVIADPQPATKYIINVKHAGAEADEFGGAVINIEVDQTEVEVAETFEIVAAPTIKGTNFSIDAPVMASKGQFTAKKVWITGSAFLDVVNVTCSTFASLPGFSSATVDLLHSTEAIISALNNYGIYFTYAKHDDTGFAEMKIVFDEEMLNSLDNGEYPIDIEVVDVNGRRASATMNLSVSDALAVTDEVPATAGTTWATRATVSATLAADSYESLGFHYRAQGESAWQEVVVDGASRSAYQKGDTFTAELTGLRPGTTYEVAAFVDAFEARAVKFTTEAAAQLPNSSFEQYTMSGKAYIFTDSEANMFWDSGNHGSVTMNINVTTPSTDNAVDGSHTVKLESAYPSVFGVGKFAAGNIFVGKYLATDGTDGVLGWGRPFTSRPTKLRGYVKYDPATVGYENSAVPDIKKGQLDKGMIYIALLDDHTTTYEGQQWPVIIQTKASNRSLFDKNGEHVIAYGELEFSASTGGMIEFEIPLDYHRTDLKPSYVILTCSASKGGDYFSGGVGSTMYLDAFELVYE